MRKLIFGLAAVLSLVFAMSSNALAQETTEEDPTEPQPVACTMLNFTPPEWRNENGSYPAGTPISLELYVPKGGPMYYYFMASLDGGESYRLNDGMDNSIEWTPIEPGTYTVYGQFESTKDGSSVPVEHPEACMVTLTVEAAQVNPQPEPQAPTVPTEPTCGEDEDPTTLVPVLQPDGSTAWYTPDGAYCGTNLPDVIVAPAPITPAAAAAPVPAAVAELPRTGTATTVLAIAGVCLVLIGLALKFIVSRLPYARPMR